LLVAARRLERVWPDLPAAALPCASLGPYHKAMYVRALASTELQEAFYDRERVIEKRLWRMVPEASVPAGVRFAWVTHLSRSGSTLLSRLLSARGDALSFREPQLLTRTLARAELEVAGRAHWLGFARAILTRFAGAAQERGAALVVVKLPSCLSSGRYVPLLREVCGGRVVYLSRCAREIQESHARSGSAAPAQLEVRGAELRRASDATVAYEELGDFSGWAGAFELRAPAEAQRLAMAAEMLLDSKTRERRAA
jgi:hypothetical protein